MKRLTNARNRCVFCKAADEECAFAAGEFSAPCPDYKTYQRLSAIEDILGDEYNLEYLKWLVEAEREGRCVVLPCKDWFEIVFGEQDVFYRIDMDYEEHPIRKLSVDSAERFIWYNGWKSVHLLGYDENGLIWEFEPEEVGETVFLTEEEAETALKKVCF